MLNKEQKVRAIHRLLIILIIILTLALFLEFKYEKGEKLVEEINVASQEKGHFIVPGIKKEVGLFEPEIDLSETKSEYIVKCDLPGVDKDQVGVSVKGNYLTISGRRDIKREKTEEGIYYYKERRSGFFQRTILLPDLVCEEAIKAEYKDGILVIKLPKQEPAEEKESREIQII